MMYELSSHGCYEHHKGEHLLVWAVRSDDNFLAAKYILDNTDPRRRDMIAAIDTVKKRGEIPDLKAKMEPIEKYMLEYFTDNFYPIGESPKD